MSNFTLNTPISKVQKQSIKLIDSFKFENKLYSLKMVPSISLSPIIS